MKKTQINLLFLIILFIFSCKGSSKEVTKYITHSKPIIVPKTTEKKFVPETISKNDLPLQEYLINTKWVPDYQTLGASIQFNRDQTITMRINYEGDHHWWSSYYTIKNQEIVLYLDFSYTNGELDKSRTKFTFKISNSVPNINYSECLVSDETDTIFWNAQKKIPRTGEAEFDGIRVTLLEKKAFVSSSTFFYTLPDLNSEKYFNSIGDGETSTPESYTIPRDFCGDTIPIEIIGIKAEDPGWYLIYRPIISGGYSVMDVRGKRYGDNYCWVTADSIAFE